MAYIDEINRLKEMQKQQAAANLEKSKAASLAELEQLRNAKTGEYNTAKSNQASSLDQYRNNQSTALGDTRNKNISTLDAEQAKIQPMYYDKRNQESTSSQLQAKNFAEFLANRGQSSAGVAGQSELNRTATLQGNIGALNRDETAQNQDVLRRKTDVNTSYDSAIQGLNNDYNLKLKELEDTYNLNLQSLNTDILGKTSSVNSQYENDLNNQYAGIETNYANQLAQYQQQQEENARQERLAQQQREYEAEQARQNREYEAQQAAVAYQRQQSLAKASASAKSSQPTQAQINAQQKASYEKQQKEIYNEFYGQDNDYDKSNWLRQYRTQIINTLGPDEYQKMLKSIDQTAANNIGDLRQTNYENQQDRLRQRLGE